VAKKTPKQIVEEDMPDVEIVDVPSTPRPDARRRSTRPGPTMADLRKKYLGSDVEEDEAADAADRLTADEEDVEVKRVRTKQRSADPADDPGPRVIIISKENGILGSQG
jgi:hypothetical protein